MVRLLAELELSPNTSFERELVSDGEMVSLTPENMDALKRYSDEVSAITVYTLVPVTCLLT